MSSHIKEIIITSLVFIIISLICPLVFANDTTNLSKKVEYTQEYKEWLALSDEEKAKTIQPRMYDILPETTDVSNPMIKSSRLFASATSSYTLKGKIPMTIKNQLQTNTCWTFASLSSLETNLALTNIKSIGSTSEYDFSERHMEYSSSQSFTNGKTKSPRIQ